VFYYFPWIILMLASLVASLALFAWALGNGQFSEQARARFLPLDDRVQGPGVADQGKVTLEVYVLVGIMAAAGASLVVTLLLVLIKGHGGS
jgi:nitrogen fixation-related uncharacterized protein